MNRQWEYKLTNDHFENLDLIISLMNDLGSEGWEIIDVEINPNRLSIGYEFRAVLKRELINKGGTNE